MCNNHDGAKALVSQRADVNNTQGSDGSSPLHAASFLHESPWIMIEVLLRTGVELSQKAPAIESPLHIAASQGLTEIVEAFLNHGADANEQDYQGDTPLHRVCYKYFGPLVIEELIWFLKSACADPSIANF